MGRIEMAKKKKKEGETVLRIKICIRNYIFNFLKSGKTSWEWALYIKLWVK